MTGERSATVQEVGALVASLNAALEASERRSAELAADNDDLRAANTQLKGDVEDERTQKEHILEAAERLRSQLAAILKKVFERTSERMDPAQLWLNFESLLDDAQRELLEQLARKQVAESPSPKPRRKAPRGAAAHPQVKRERTVVEPPAEDRTCEACEGALGRIGEDVSSELLWVPGHFVLRDTVRGKWACRCGLGTVVSTPAPASPIPCSIASSSLLAYLAVSKHADHLPLYRQARILGRSGVTLPTSTLSDWMHQAAQMLGPVREALVADVVASDIVALDDTRLELQLNSKRQRKKRCFLWGFREPGGTVVFEFSRSRGGETPARFLESVTGWLQCDDARAHDVLFKGRTDRIRVGCWAHARRKHVYAMDSDPERASLAIALIGRLYDVEREARDGNLDASARAQLRRERCPQVLDMLHDLLENWRREVLPKSAMGGAIRYTLQQWEALTRYLEDGRVGIDNNPLEAGIRGIALTRRNSLFVGSEQGGHDAALFHSIIGSCKGAGVEPMAYMTDVIERLTADPGTDPVALTPKRWLAARAADDVAGCADSPAN